MIVVMGATGNTGRGIVEAALTKGRKVRALGRSADRLQDLVRRGATAVAGDATDAGYLARAFAGATALFALIPPNPQSPDYPAEQDRVGEAIARGIQESGVPRVVFLSSVGAELPRGTGPIAGLHRQEERLRRIPGLSALFLRAAFFMENFFGSLPLIKHQGINGGALAPDRPIPMVATRDISAVAAQALLARDFAGIEVRYLLGPRDLSVAEVTRILGVKIGKPDLKYVQFSYDAFAGALRQAGFSKNVADLYIEMSRATNEGTIAVPGGRHAGNTTPTAFESFSEVLAAAFGRA